MRVATAIPVLLLFVHFANDPDHLSSVTGTAWVRDVRDSMDDERFRVGHMYICEGSLELVKCVLFRHLF